MSNMYVLYLDYIFDELLQDRSYLSNIKYTCCIQDDCIRMYCQKQNSMFLVFCNGTSKYHSLKKKKRLND